jgi:hypothetical protein
MDSILQLAELLRLTHDEIVSGERLGSSILAKFVIFMGTGLRTRLFILI